MRALYRQGGWVIALAALVLNLVHAARHHHLDSVPEIGDGVDYDSMGLNLARGRGFGYFRADPEWRAPYETAIANGQDQYAALMLRDKPFEPTTYRPPLFPVLLAGIYATFGRHFIIWRVLSCALGALAGLLTFNLARRLAGPAAGWLAGALFLIDPYQRHFAGTYLTESLATLLVVAMMLAMLETIRRPTPAWFAALGGAMALAVLTRGIFIFLLPPAGLVALWVAWRERRGRGIAGLAAFVLAAGVLMGPWWVRNCVALDAFMPLGVQGWVNMPAAYNDAVLDNGGDWIVENRDEAYRRAGYRTAPGLNRLQSERARADAGREITMQWIRENPGKVPVLFGIKVATLWGSSRFGLVVLTAALLGLAFARPFRLRWPIYAVIAVYTIGVGLTWTTGGRFRIPMMPLVFALAADTVLALAIRTGWFRGAAGGPDPD